MNNITKEELAEFYKSHSNQETADFLGVSKSQLLRILAKWEIPKKVAYKKHTSVNDTITELLARIDIDQYKTDAMMLTQKQLCEKYNITIRQIKYLKEKFNIDNRIKYSSDYNIDPIELESYYKQHTLTETAKYFNINNISMLRLLLKKYNINTESRIQERLPDAVNRIDKEALQEYYNAHTLKETADHFNTKLIPQLLKYYNIDKKTKPHESINDVLLRINKDEFVADFKTLNVYELFNKYNISYTMYRSLISEFNLGFKPGVFTYDDASLSKYEDDLYLYLCTLIDKDDIIRHDRNVLNGQELDFYIPAKNIGIEFNGNFWHSDLKKEKSYHFNKSKLADEKGIRLIHIWEYEWLDINQQQKIKQLLNIALGTVKTRIYARNCTIRQISNKEAKPFNDKTHLQGHRDAQVTYGLFYKDKLVQLMSFSQTKYNKNLSGKDEWEIIRGCPGSNNIVIGGVSKLLKHFILDYQPKLIFSYCDFNKFNGKSYETAGMTFNGYTGPDLKYMLQDGTVVNRNPHNYKYNKEHCSFRLYGAGSKKYIMNLERV